MFAGPSTVHDESADRPAEPDADRANMLKCAMDTRLVLAWLHLLALSVEAHLGFDAKGAVHHARMPEQMMDLDAQRPSIKRGELA